MSQQPPQDLRGKKLTIADFELGKTLGTGSFGRVRFATYNKGNPAVDFFALKILKKSAIIRLKQVDHISSEKEILMALSHPFIVNLFGCFHDPRYLYFINLISFFFDVLRVAISCVFELLSW